MNPGTSSPKNVWDDYYNQPLVVKKKTQILQGEAPPSYMLVYKFIHYFSPVITLPILDTLQHMTNSLLVNVDIPIDTKRLKD